MPVFAQLKRGFKRFYSYTIGRRYSRKLNSRPRTSRVRIDYSDTSADEQSDLFISNVRSRFRTGALPLRVSSSKKKKFTKQSRLRNFSLNLNLFTRNRREKSTRVSLPHSQSVLRYRHKSFVNMAIFKFRQDLGRVLRVGKGSMSFRTLTFVVLICGVLSSEYTVGLLSAILRARHFTQNTVMAAEGTDLYKYETETNLVLDDVAEFDAQTFTNGNFKAGQSDLASYSSSDDYLGLNHYGDNPPNTVNADWWDDDSNSATKYNWPLRKCFLVDFSGGTTTQTDYQIYIDVDTASLVSAGKMQANGADIRFADDEGVRLDHYIADDMNEASTRVWVQLNGIVAGARKYVCMYYSNPTATSVSSAADTFDYPTPTELYYVVQDTTGIGTLADFVSYADGNDVEFEGYLNTLNEFDYDTHGGGTITYQQTTPISVTKPITGSFVNNGTDALSPASFAGTAFTYRMDRGTNEFSFVSPWCDANVEVRNGLNNIVTAGSFTIPAGTSHVLTTTNTTSTGLPNNDAVIIESTNSCPVIVTHHSTSDQDTFTMYPASLEWYGVASGNLEVSALLDGTTVDIYLSDGNTYNISLDRGDEYTLNPLGSEGSDPSARVVADQPIGVSSRADSDGSESATFLPAEELNYKYYFPQDMQYITIATLTDLSTTVDLYSVSDTCGDGSPDGGTFTVSPTSPSPGKVYFGSTTDGTNILAGACIVSDQPIFAYYEKSSVNDETNVWGIKQNRQYIYPAPTVAVGATEAGSWSTDGIDTWNARRPITFTNNSSEVLSDYQVRVDINGLSDVYTGSQADGGDLRLAGVLGDSSDNRTYWLEDYDSVLEQASLWAQFPLVPASGSSTLYLYYNSSAGTHTTTGSEIDTFSYDDPKNIFYVADSNSLGSDLDIISYADGNIINDTGDSYSIDEGDIVTVPQASVVLADDSLSATAPLHIGFDQDTSESAVPIGYAGTEFVHFAARNSDVVNVYSPYGDATVQISQGTTSGYTVLNTTVVSEGNAASISQDITNFRALKITSDIPVLATYRSDTADSVVLYPTDLAYENDSGMYELYGVGSYYVGLAVANDNTNVTVYRSNGTTATTTVGASDNFVIFESGAGAHGTGYGYHIVADGPIAAIGIEDLDGSEAVSFVSQKEFYTTYALSGPAQYFAAVTKDSSVTCNVYDETGTPVGALAGMDNVPPQTSGALLSPYPNKIHIGGDDSGDPAFFSAGYTMVCDQPVYAYFDHHLGGAISDQTSWLTYPQGRKYTYPEPSVSSINSSLEEGLYYESGFDSAGAGTDFEAYMEVDIDGGDEHTYWHQIEWTEDVDIRTFENSVVPLNAEMAYGDGVDCSTAAYSVFTPINSEDYFSDEVSDHRCVRLRFYLRTGDEAYTPKLLSLNVSYYQAALLEDQSSMPTISIRGNLSGSDERRRILKAVTSDIDLTGSDAFLSYRGGLNTTSFTNADFEFLEIQTQTINPQFDFPPFPGGEQDAATTSGFDATNSIAVYFTHDRVSGATSEIDATFKADIIDSGGPLIYRDFILEVSGI